MGTSKPQKDTVSSETSSSSSYNTSLSDEAFKPQGYVAIDVSDCSSEEAEEEKPQSDCENPCCPSDSSASAHSDATACMSNLSNKATSPTRRQFYPSTDYALLMPTQSDDAPLKKPTFLNIKHKINATSTSPPRLTPISSTSAESS